MFINKRNVNKNKNFGRALDVDQPSLVVELTCPLCFCLFSKRVFFFSCVVGRFDEVFCVKKFVADKSDVFRLNCKLELIVSKGYGLVYLVLVVRAKESFVGLRCCRRRSGLEKRGLWCLPPVKRYFTSLTIKPERPCKLALLLHYDRGHSEGLLLLGRSRGRGGRKERRHGIKKCTSLVLLIRKKGLVFIVSKKRI